MGEDGVWKSSSGAQETAVSRASTVSPHAATEVSQVRMALIEHGISIEDCQRFYTAGGFAIEVFLADRLLRKQGNCSRNVLGLGNQRHSCKLPILLSRVQRSSGIISIVSTNVPGEVLLHFPRIGEIM